MTGNRHLLKGLVVLCCLWHGTPCDAKDWTLYSDAFRDHYPTLGRRFNLTQYELEAPVVVWDVGQHRKITVLRTRGDRYGYERQKCVITIEGEGLKRPRFLSVVGFRLVKTCWITGKLVLIKLDVGHVAGVEAIYDAEKDKLIYCESVEYGYSIEPGAPRDGGPTKPPGDSSLDGEPPSAS